MAEMLVHIEVHLLLSQIGGVAKITMIQIIKLAQLEGINHTRTCRHS